MSSGTPVPHTPQPWSSHTSCTFFFNHTATTEIYTLSLHDALPISCASPALRSPSRRVSVSGSSPSPVRDNPNLRSEEHTSELQSQSNLVCRLLLEKKKKMKKIQHKTRCTMPASTTSPAPRPFPIVL